MSKIIILYGQDRSAIKRVANFIAVNNIAASVTGMFDEIDQAVDQVLGNANFPMTISEGQVKKLAAVAYLGVVSTTKYKGQTLNSMDEAITYARTMATAKSGEAFLLANKTNQLPDGVHVIVGPASNVIRDEHRSLVSKSGDKIAWLNVLTEAEETSDDFFVLYSEDKKSFKSSLSKVLKAIDKEWNGGSK